MSTYTPIASQTISSTTSTVTFSNIPQNFTDLVLVTNILDSNGYSVMRFNNDSGNNYSRTWMFGNGSTAGSNRGSNISGLDLKAATSGSELPVCIVQINNYSNTTTNKTVLIRQAYASNEVAAYVGLWRNTAAISTLTITNNMLANSTFTLYGIASASASAKASGGNIVTTDGTYWYHTFTSSGTFTPLQALTADYLVVAGGGGSGYSSSGNGTGTGGGGAGGLRCTVGSTGGGGSLESPLSLTAQAYTVTVGAGGTGGTSSSVDATDGSNSVFSTITSTGGGGSRSSGLPNGAVGRSGGSGAGNANGSTGTTNTGTANQGFAGGLGASSFGTGGGGGAGQIGGTASGNDGGTGGNGLAISITGSSVNYAGGGAGGRGVSGAAAGVAGTGGTAVNTNGTANTGAGGGGANSSINAGYAGGSGVVVVRYLV
jgi:hypothetical protein